jgi:hypothetical protein
MPPKIAIFLASIGLLLSGCEPSCEATCEKLMSCDEIEMDHIPVQECATTCEIQQRIYEKWDSSDEREWFSDMKYCIDDASCGDIADGECYDDELYIW